MPKEATLLVMGLSLLLFTAPATAQPGAGEGRKGPASPNPAITGVLEKPEITTYMYGSHAITDETSGVRYALRSEEENLLDDYVGQRVTVSGTLVAGYEGGAIEGGPPLIEVGQVEPAVDDATAGEDLNGDGVVDQADGEFAAAVSDTAREAAKKSEQSVLPATGGPAIPLAIASLLLVVGLLILRVLR